MPALRLGIDPGKTNLGWAIRKDDRWATGVLVFSGPLPYRLLTFYNWLVKLEPHLEMVAVEVLKGGRYLMTWDIASFCALAAIVAERANAVYAEVQPSTHYYCLTEIGKHTLVYDRAVKTIIGKTSCEIHELTAAGTLITAERALVGDVPFKIKDAVRFLRRPS